MASVTEMQSPAAAGVLSAVAHELRQPRSTIESIAYYLKLILPAGSALIENLFTLFRQVGGEVTVRTSAAEGSGVLLVMTTLAAALGAGAALSVDSARRIVEAHGGSLDLTVDAANGIRVAVMLP